MPPLVPPAPMKKTRRVASRARAREIVITGRPVNGVYVSASVGDVNSGFSCKQSDSLGEARTPSTRRRQAGKAGERSATSVFANKSREKKSSVDRQIFTSSPPPLLGYSNSERCR